MSNIVKGVFLLVVGAVAVAMSLLLVVQVMLGVGDDPEIEARYGPL
jgi:hypothetical protein